MADMQYRTCGQPHEQRTLRNEEEQLMESMRYVMVAILACLTGCVSTHDRPIEHGSSSAGHEPLPASAGIANKVIDVNELFRARIGERLGLSMGASGHLIFQVDDIERAENYRAWTAHLVGATSLYRAYIVQTGDEIAGSIDLPTATYRISGSVNNTSLQRVLRPPVSARDATPSDGRRPTFEIPNEVPTAAGVPDPGPIEPVNLRVVTLIARELADGYPGGLFKLQAYLNLIQKKARQAMKDSRVYIDLQFIAPQAGLIVDGRPMGGSNADVLTNITPAEGLNGKWSIHIRSAKRSASADLVVLYTSNRGSDCGQAWVGGHRESPDAAKVDLANAAQIGYSVVNIDEAKCDDYTLAHEIGHNLGSVHDHETQAGFSERGAFDYMYGHRGNGFVTIMGYHGAAHRRLGVFSNPNTACLGQACGIIPGAPNAADNATGFNGVRAKVGRWRFFRDLSIVVTGPGTVMGTYPEVLIRDFRRLVALATVLPRSQVDAPSD